MADMNQKPVVSDDMTAGILAAIKRAESIPAGTTLIDSMSDEDWLSDDPEIWNICAGSTECEYEIDDLDMDVVNAA